jgi:hypothetical protein
MGFLFEYSRQDTEINALEVGIGMDLFPKDIPIMATEANSFFFTNLYVGYRFGKVINITEAAQSKTFREKLDDRKQQRQILKRQKKAGRDNYVY